MIPAGALTISPDGRRATLELTNVDVIDQASWPEHDAPAIPARMSFRAEWEATPEPARYADAAKMFRFDGWRAVGRIEASVEVPSIGFSWRSDPIGESRSMFGIIGEEMNGRYY